MYIEVLFLFFWLFFFYLGGLVFLYFFLFIFPFGLVFFLAAWFLSLVFRGFLCLMSLSSSLSHPFIFLFFPFPFISRARRAREQNPSTGDSSWHDAEGGKHGVAVRLYPCVL